MAGGAGEDPGGGGDRGGEAAHGAGDVAGDTEPQGRGGDSPAGGAGEGLGGGDRARQYRRRDESRVVDEQDPAFGHGADERPVYEGEGAVGIVGVLADQVGGRGVAVAGDGDQVGEGRLDQRGLPGTGRSVQQGRLPFAARTRTFLKLPVTIKIAAHYRWY